MTGSSIMAGSLTQGRSARGACRDVHVSQEAEGESGGMNPFGNGQRGSPWAVLCADIDPALGLVRLHRAT